MIKGLVSIIIPTYNRADFVLEAIESAKAQAYPHTQIIVVDDGSNDDTARRLASIEGIEYYHQENKGQGAARNHGLRHARGEFIASLDSDDLWDTDFLTRSVECLEALNLDFVFTNWVKLRGVVCLPSDWFRVRKSKQYRTNQSGEWSILDADEIRKLFLALCPAPSSSLVIRRSSIVSGWGEHMQIADDWYLVLEMVLTQRCRAAFSLTPRWKKRVDGNNVYDEQPFAPTVRKLYVHDYPLFRRDFRTLLTRWEKVNLLLRVTKYRVRLFLHEAGVAALVARLKRSPVPVPSRKHTRLSLGSRQSIERRATQEE